jgi:hypothetical protein
MVQYESGHGLIHALIHHKQNDNLLENEGLSG